MPKSGPRPQVWITGPDPLTHKKYLAWLQQKNQAQWRGETWDLSFEQWSDLWFAHWHQRGRTRYDYCMVRRDPEGCWDINNVEVITREEHCIRHRARQGITRGRKRLEERGIDADV